MCLTLEQLNIKNTEMKNSNTIIVGDINTPRTLAKLSRQEVIEKKIELE